MKKTDITYQDKLNELRLDISHPNSKGINFIFVEGNSDIKLFRKLFNLDKCKVENIPGGKIKLEECVSDLLTIYPLIIGIRDADFIHLNSNNYSKLNMFLTDFHDIEITMLSQVTVLNALVFEFTNLPKEEHIVFRDKIMKSINRVGFLKWLNDRENLKLKFTSGFQDLISFTNLNIDFNEYLKRVISKSKNAKIKDATILKKKVDELVLLEPNLLQLTSGHDLLKAFSKYFKENDNDNSGLSEERLASAFRMTFTVNHFKETKLYNDLLYWEKSTNIEIFNKNASS